MIRLELISSRSKLDILSIELQALFITDEVGFEPTIFYQYADFQGQCFQPLSHSSVNVIIRIYMFAITLSNKVICTIVIPLIFIVNNKN